MRTDVGLLAFSELVANSSRWATAEVKKSAELKDSYAHAALATQQEGGSVCTVLRVLVIAKDELDGEKAGGVSVTVKVPASLLARPEPTATLLRLTAPALDSRTGVRYAGQGFDGSMDGLPTAGPRAGESVAMGGTPGEFGFSLPHLSAAILVVKECTA